MIQRIRDARNDTPFVRAIRIVVFLGALFGAAICLHHAGKDFGDPNSALTRYRTPAVAPRVFARGTLHVQHQSSGERPIYCSVEHERWVSCGKNYCWRTVEGFRYSAAALDVDWSSSKLPNEVGLDPHMRFEPWRPPKTIVSETARTKFWMDFAEKNG